MHAYRTHSCADLRKSDVGETIRLSGWVHRKRDHGQLLFVELRDHHGITQIVTDTGSPAFKTLDRIRVESVVTIDGEVVARSAETVNPSLPTGEIEVRAGEVTIQSTASELPMPVFGEQEYPEEIRLKYRYLDLRREQLHANIMLRSAVIGSIRRRMVEQGFTEFQTPILTASSPEGARDYLVPSRIHPGKFYALPQAPQQFKQLIMVAGFDRYFQIAPCFRDEDARADRSPGEFYQLDIEMSFVTQEDVFNAVEPVLRGVFEEFGGGKLVTPGFPMIPYREAMLKYGTDKPDLRNPPVIAVSTAEFGREEVTFNAFKNVIKAGGVVRAIPTPGAAAQPRSFFDKLNDWARGEGAPGLGYIVLEEGDEIAHEEWVAITGRLSAMREDADATARELAPLRRLAGRGPIAKFVPREVLIEIAVKAGVKPGDAVFFAYDQELKAAKLAGAARTRIGTELGFSKPGVFEFCWIVDFPMYEWNEDEKKIDFSHNPFSMPQGGLEALETKDPLDILAFQYDIVCNGVELSSGAIRNHRPDIMKKAFEIAGYDESVLLERFGGMYRAFQYVAPPHGGSAPGIDRIVMLLAGEDSIREVIAFPKTAQARDLMTDAPSPVPERALRELHIDVVAEEVAPGGEK